MVWDMIIIGAGPGGLQAAIAASSEGMKVLVLEKGQVGGQIGQTPKLENSVFCRGGITGPEFAAAMRDQALAMGAEIRAAEATALCNLLGSPRLVNVGSLKSLAAHTIVIAVGNKWNELNVPGVRENVNGHVHVGPLACVTNTPTEYPMVYGGGPAAGQAVIRLANSREVSRVYHLTRSGLKMPEYLVSTILADRRVVQLSGTIKRVVRGDDGLYVALNDGTPVHVTDLFLCNGLTPDTGFLRGSGLKIDKDGRIETDGVKTNFPGVFAIGDCRAGSTARVGVAIGDGSMAVTEAWRYFNASSYHPLLRPEGV